MQTVVGNMKDETERSQFLTQKKFELISECVEAWPTLSSEERKEWPQGYAWVRKYAVISAGGGNVLVFTGEAKKKPEADEAEEAVAVPLALDAAVRMTHQGCVFDDLRSVHISGGHSK